MDIQGGEVHMKDFLYVKTIAEEKSINRAAQKLFLSQPSLTKFLHRLEKTLGYSLFTRTAQGISLTSYGKLYYDMACEILDVYEKNQKKIALVQSKDQGKLTIGASWYVQACFLSDCINRFCLRYPSVQMQFIEASSTVLLHQMEQESDMDLIFVHRGKEETGCLSKYLCSEVVAEEPFYLAVPASMFSEEGLERDARGYAVLSVDQIARTPLVRFQESQKIWKITEKALERGHMTPPGTVFVHGFPNALNLVASGYGMAILPLYYLKQAQKQQIPIEIYGLPAEMQCGWILEACYYRQLMLPGAVKTFLRMVHTEEKSRQL
jgi:DNA-binding transcriptional LysR family regulator